HAPHRNAPRRRSASRRRRLRVSLTRCRASRSCVPMRSMGTRRRESDVARTCMNQLRIAAAWAKRQIAWSNSRQSWYERLGALALLGGAAGGWWVSSDWPGPARLGLLCAWLTLLAVVVRRGAVRLLGPVFFFELLRGSRKRVHLT